jgi:hypothetical protein
MKVDSNNRITKEFGENCPGLNLTNGNYGLGEKTIFSDVYIIRNSSKIAGRRVTEGLGVTSEVYNDYARFYQNCMVGFVKGTDTTGIIYWKNTINNIVVMNPGTFFRMFPNPANENLIIDPGTQDKYTYRITDVYGKTIGEGSKLEGSVELSTSNFPEGLYVITFSSGSITSSKKISVLH